ncbi:MAG: class I SAM-dependent methyltransferase [Streptosporangiaceae bacterium]
MESHDTHQHHDHHHDGDEAAEAAQAELLDLDAEVLHAYLSSVIDWVGELAADQPPRRILDLGCGTGTGSLALLRRFPGSEVTGVDASAPMLDHLRKKALERDVASRVRVVQADLDAGWPDTGPVDLVWASNSMHHMPDPDRVLAQVLAALQPGGLLAVAEMDSFPRFLPEGLGFGHPGLEARSHAARDDARGEDMPHLGSDWGPRLAQAGFAVEAERTFVIDLVPPLPAAVGRYALLSLQRIRSAVDGRLSAGDLAALDTLLEGDGPASILRRDDLTVRTTRTVWVARRP